MGLRSLDTSSEMLWLIGYFLSRRSVLVGHRSFPPLVLGEQKWSDAYDLFYQKFGGTRSKRGFRSTLQNRRDSFDHLFDNGRRCWFVDRPDGFSPTERVRELHHKWSALSDDDLDRHVMQALSP